MSATYRQMQDMTAQWSWLLDTRRVGFSTSGNGYTGAIRDKGPMSNACRK